jgi:cyclophilin family peptidyl-prolyl cis-trans isomerase
MPGANQDFFMKMWTRLFLIVAALAYGGSAEALDAQNSLYMDLAFGRVLIAMDPTVAPRTVDQIKKLVRAGFYNGVVFHRVIDGFMAQTGDPTGTGAGGSGHPLKAEFSKQPFVRGVVAMARTSDPNSADSQFFIMYAAAPDLDGKYTIFGHVESGMEYVDKIKKGDPANNGKVVNPDKIIKMQVVSDVITAQEKEQLPKEKSQDAQQPDNMATRH